MQDWARPNTIRQWLKRLFGLQALVVGLLIILLALSELRFDWVEQVVGNYLTTTNARRPKIGAIWEKGKQATTARQTLEQIVTDRQASQRDALVADSFNQLAAGISEGQGIMLSPDHFKKLYLKLPVQIAREITSPFELLGLFSQDSWDRTYFETSAGELKIYLLDAENRVLKQMTITPNLLQYMDQSSTFSATALTTLPQFENRIYPADDFFSVLADLPEDVRKSVLPHPEKLLALPGQILRVGISDEAVSGFIELGFEITDGTRQEVVRFQGQEWAVWRTRSILEGNPRTAESLSDFFKGLKLR